MLVSPGVADDSPIDRLQQRSADLRWRKAKDEWLPVDEQENTPNQSTTQAAPEATLPSTNSDSIFVNPFSDFESSLEMPVPLFDPKPTSISSSSTAKTEESEAPKVSHARPFPGLGIDNMPEPVRRKLVPDPYEASIDGNLNLKSMEILTAPSPETKPLTGIRVAQASDLPPAPDASATPTSIPQLRNIKDIKPFSSYVPVLDRPTLSAKTNADSHPNYLELPESGSLEYIGTPTNFHWMAANVSHNPLYFEDVNLERYGYSYPSLVQPFVSIGKFGLQVAGLPYQIALNPVDCEEYSLGYYRPGDCPPALRYRIPFNKKAAATAAATYTGLIFLFP